MVRTTGSYQQQAMHFIRPMVPVLYPMAGNNTSVLYPTILPTSCPAPVLVAPSQMLSSTANRMSCSSPPAPSSLSQDVESPVRARSESPLSSCGSPPPLTPAASVANSAATTSAQHLVSPYSPPMASYVMVRMIPMAAAAHPVTQYMTSTSTPSISSEDQDTAVEYRGLYRSQSFTHACRIHGNEDRQAVRMCHSASDIELQERPYDDSQDEAEMDVHSDDVTSPAAASTDEAMMDYHGASFSSTSSGRESSRKVSVRRKRGPYQHFSRSQRLEIAQFAAIHGSTCAARHFTQRYNRPVKRSTIDSMVANLRAKKCFPTAEPSA